MITIGVIGCSNIAKKLIKRIDDNDIFRFSAFASRTKDKAEAFANEFKANFYVGYESVLNSRDIDAVYITLPPALHYEWIKLALHAGKHVIVEKTMCLNHEQTVEVLLLAKKNKLVLFENYMFLFHRQNQLVKKMIENYEIGEIVSVQSTFSIPNPKSNDKFRYCKELGGSSLIDVGGYPIKLSQMILGDNLTVIDSYLEYSNFYNIDLSGCATLINKKNKIAQVYFGYGSFYKSCYDVLGEYGKIYVDNAFTIIPQIMPDVTITKSDFVEKVDIPADNHFRNIIEEFCECISNCDINKYHDSIYNHSKIIQQIMEHGKGNKI